MHNNYQCIELKIHLKYKLYKLKKHEEFHNKNYEIWVKFYFQKDIGINV